MWSGLTLTEKGKQALISAQLSNVLNIKSIVIGDGDAPADYHKCNELVHQLYELTDLKIDTVQEGCQITVDFPNIDYDYYFREIGVIVTTDSGEVLYVYDNAGDDAQCIHAENTAGKIQKRLRLVLAISDVKNITISKTSPLYVDYDEFTKHTSDAEHHTTVQEKTKWNNMLSEAKKYSDATYQQATGYADKVAADLIGGAPETLNTINKIADAVKDNKDVVSALNDAIGKKTNQKEFETHENNEYIHVNADKQAKWDGYEQEIADINSNLTQVSESLSVIGGTSNTIATLKISAKANHEIEYTLLDNIPNGTYIISAVTHVDNAPIPTDKRLFAAIASRAYTAATSICSDNKSWQWNQTIFFKGTGCVVRVLPEFDFACELVISLFLMRIK